MKLNWFERERAITFIEKVSRASAGMGNYYKVIRKLQSLIKYPKYSCFLQDFLVKRYDKTNGDNLNVR